MEEEIWMDVVLPNMEGCYQVSNWGRVKSLCRSLVRRGGKKLIVPEKILKPTTQKDGYVTVILQNRGYKKKYLLHRLVALMHIPNPENKLEVNHKEGNKGDNRSWMLEWNTKVENAVHSIKTGLQTIRSGKDIKSSQPVIMLDLEGNELRNFESMGEAARVSGAQQSCIWMCVNGRQNIAGGYKWRLA